MIKNILIDIDGTLLDTKMIFYKSLNETLRFFGLQETDQELFGMSVEQALMTLGLESNLQIKDEWEKRFRELSEQIVLYPYIKKMINELSKEGINFFVVTSRSSKTADLICDNADIGMCIKGCIVAEDTLRHKPDPAPIRRALEKYNLKSNESIYIGDTYQDFMSATHAGVCFGLAAWNGVNVERNYLLVFKSPLEII